MKRLIILLGLLSLSLTGCWDRVELEDRDFVIVLGADLTEAGLELTACLGATEEENAAVAAGLCGNSPQEAMGQLDYRTSQSSYYGSARTLVVGRALWEDTQALAGLLTYLESQPEINKRLLLVAAEENAAPLVSSLPGTGVPYGMYFSTYFKNHPETPTLDLATALLALAQGEKPSPPRFGLDEAETPVFLPEE